MSKELATVPAQQQRIGALAVMAARFNVEPKKLLETLKGTVFKEARNDEEMMALCIVANEYGLNPLTKEIYAFPAKGGGIVPVVSIDGWINRANSHPEFDGLEFQAENDKDGKPISCTAVIYRKDRTRPIKVTEYFSECFRATDPWKQMPHRMLRHKALIQCVRVAFGFSGVYDEDDASDIKPVRGVVVSTPIFNNPHTAQQPAIEADATVEHDEIPMGEPDAQPEVNTSAITSGPNVARVRKLIAETQGITEKAMLAYICAQLEQSFTSLDEIGEQIAYNVAENWKTVSKDIVKKGGAQ